MGLLKRFKLPNLSGIRARMPSLSPRKVLSATKSAFAKTKGALKNSGPTLKKLRSKLNTKDLQAELKKINPQEALENTLAQVRKLTSNQAYGTYLRMAASGFAAFFLADTVSLFTDALIPDPPPVPAMRVVRKEDKKLDLMDYAAILDRNIFNSLGLVPEETGGPGGPARKTSLPLNLIGTVVLQDELKSIAAIEDKSQNLVFPVRVDDIIDNRVKITKIEHLKVFFINQSTGYLEYVEIIDDVPNLSAHRVQPASSLKKPTGVTKSDDTHYDIDRGAVDKALGNLSELLQQARAIPNFENGAPDGFRLLQIAPGSLYEQIGLKDNDVLCGLNGDPINDPAKAFQIFNELKTSSHIELCVKRHGRKMNLSYDIR